MGLVATAGCAMFVLNDLAVKIFSVRVRICVLLGFGEATEQINRFFWEVIMPQQR